MYDHAGNSLYDFRQELEQIVQKSFEFRIGRETGGAGTPFPTLELILAFAASAFMGSVLSELGKDVYNTLKGKLFKKPFENESTMVFIITIVAPEMVTIGRIKTVNHNDVIEGLKNAKEMVDHAGHRNISEIEQIATERIRDRDKLITERCNLVFHYEYDASEAKWVLMKIARIEKVT